MIDIRIKAGEIGTDPTIVILIIMVGAIGIVLTTVIQIALVAAAVAANTHLMTVMDHLCILCLCVDSRQDILADIHL